MTKEQVNNAYINHFGLLKKTGKGSLCDLKKLVVMPLLVSMTTGDLAVWQTAEGKEVVDSFIRKNY